MDGWMEGGKEGRKKGRRELTNNLIHDVMEINIYEVVIHYSMTFVIYG